ncbi:MAG: hypothetical protein ABI367_13895 [Mucilaginibacter sp.]
MFTLLSAAFSQQIFSENPFKNVKFLKAQTDTATLVAIYNRVIDSVDLKSQSLATSIKRQTGKSIKGLKYAIELTLPGYSKLIAPCTDIGMFNTLKGIPPNTPISIKCVVFRFYFFDGLCNFFYVDKLHINKRD